MDNSPVPVINYIYSITSITIFIYSITSFSCLAKDSHRVDMDLVDHPKL